MKWPTSCRRELAGQHRPGSAHQRVADQRRPCDALWQLVQTAKRGQSERVAGADRRELHCDDELEVLRRGRTDVNSMAAQDRRQFVEPRRTACRAESRPTEGREAHPAARRLRRRARRRHREAIRTPRFSRDTSIASNSGPGGRSRTSATSSVSPRSAANCAAVDSRRGTTRVSGNFEVKRANAAGSTSGSSSSGIASLMTLSPPAVNSAIVASAWSRRASTARASARNVIPASVGCAPVLLRTNSVTANSRSRFVDGLRQRGLADMEAARGGRQPALLHDRDERGEFAELHVYGRQVRAIRRAYRRTPGNSGPPTTNEVMTPTVRRRSLRRPRVCRSRPAPR